jgi:hypothetical protein
MMSMIHAMTILDDVAFERANPDELLALYDASAVVFAELSPERAQAARSAAHTLREAQKRQMVFLDVLRNGNLEAAR